MIFMYVIVNIVFGSYIKVMKMLIERVSDIKDFFKKGLYNFWLLFFFWIIVISDYVYKLLVRFFRYYDRIIKYVV